MSSHRGRKSALPPVGDLAAAIRDGATYDDLADDHGVRPAHVRARVRDAGYDPDTGYPHTRPSPVLAELAQHIGRMPDLPGALCAETDPDLFYPEKGGSTRDAKATCMRCEVRDSCLQAALDNGERFGIWGGLSERERRALTHAARDNQGDHAA